MSNFTFESNLTGTPLETFEWDNVWIHNANDLVTRRVLYIGDSISCATRGFATAAAEGKLLFDGFGTSKAVDNPFFFDAVRIFAMQERYRNIIVFNNGLHGWHLDDTKEYPKFYEQLIVKLLEEFKGTQIALLLTTSVADAKTEERVKVRNDEARKIAAKYDLPIIDIYSVAAEFADLRSGDGVHYTEPGYKKFAEKIVADINRLLNI